MKRLIGFDVETSLIAPGRQFPPLACLTYCEVEIAPLPHSSRAPLGYIAGPEVCGIVPPERALDVFMEWVGDPDVHLVAHNAKFDVGALANMDPERTLVQGEVLWEALREGRISCTLVREKLCQNYHGRLGMGGKVKPPGAATSVGLFSLAGLVWNRLRVDIVGSKVEGGGGPDPWRRRYGTLIGIPLAEWPAAAVEYAIQDAVWAARVFLHQEADARHPEVFCDEPRRVFADFCFALSSAHGTLIDDARRDRLGEVSRKAVEEGEALLSQAGILDKKKDGTYKRNMAAFRERVTQAFAGNPPRTDKGNVKTDRPTLLQTGDPLLAQYARLGPLRTVAQTFVPAITVPPDTPIHPYIDVLKKTGRVSAARPNTTNIPVSLNVRECFRCRPGHVFLGGDYDANETRALAQVLLDMFGWSHLAEEFQRNPDYDPHTAFAKFLVGDEAWDKLSPADRRTHRQRAKAAVFGWPGGLGAATFVTYARGYGVDLTLAEAKALKQDFIKSEPALKQYFRHAGRLANASPLLPGGGGGALYQHPRSRRFRGGCSYTHLCNTPFQGLAADGLLEALRRITRECFLRTSPLWGSRVLFVIHDEIILETPEHAVGLAARRLEELMVSGMEVFTPDIPARVSAVASDLWTKRATQVYGGDGLLTVWREAENG